MKPPSLMTPAQRVSYAAWLERCALKATGRMRQHFINCLSIVRGQ